MIRFAIAVGLYWTFWFWFEIPMLVETKTTDPEGLWVFLYTMTAVYHIAWLGRYVGR